MFSLSNGIRFLYWTAEYGTESDKPHLPYEQGGQPFDPDTSPQSSVVDLESVQFDSPPSGDWLLGVRVQFADGDAQYAWHAVIE
jgi:hypothetical protein